MTCYQSLGKEEFFATRPLIMFLHMSNPFATSILRTHISQDLIESQFYATCTERATEIFGCGFHHKLVLDLTKTKKRTYPELNLYPDLLNFISRDS